MAKLARITGIAFIIVLVLGMMVIPAGAEPESLPDAAQNAPAFVDGEILVKLEQGICPCDVAPKVGGSVKNAINNDDTYVLQVERGTVMSAVQRLNVTSGVEFAEPNYLRQLHADPNDPGYEFKWDLRMMGWDQVYEKATDFNFDAEVVVAVIDTGIDSDHPDLNDKIVDGYDFIDNDDTPTDEYGHGTHVAGIALAETNNLEGTVGVGFAPNIKVMPLKTCSQDSCASSDVAEAIYWAADNGANVINISLGYALPSASEEAAINYAWNKGVIITASSGNDSTGRVSYPAAYENCIAVGSTNDSDTLAAYSNTGKTLDVVAPGGEMTYYHDIGGIYSTMPGYDVYLTSSYPYYQNYDQMQGTSMAAPQVAGLAALIFAMDKGLSNAEVRTLIESTADDLGRPGKDRSYGFGRINIYNAVVAASGGGSTPGDVCTNSVTVTGKKAGPNKSATAVVTVSEAIEGVTVKGTWTINGTIVQTVSATTDATGAVTFQSQKVRDASPVTFTFTVTAPPVCSGGTQSDSVTL